MSYIEQRMAKCRDEINDFEAKYSMSFDEFEAKLGNELELSWEHEKDFFFWEGAKTDLKKLDEYKEKVELYGNRSFRQGNRAEYGSISLAEED